MEEYLAMEIIVRIGDGIDREDVENAVLQAVGCSGDEPNCRMVSMSSTIGTVDQCEAWVDCV